MTAEHETTEIDVPHKGSIKTPKQLVGALMA
jgi:hypothetical protein